MGSSHQESGRGRKLIYTHQPLEALQSSCLTVMKMNSKFRISRYAGRYRL
jgi:hypothetical protein